MELWLGVDLGSSSCKAVICNSNLHVLHSASREYPMETNFAGWAEHNPWVILEAVTQVIKEILGRIPVQKIKGVGFSGFMHSIMAVDQELNPITPCLAWADLRTINQVQEIAGLLSKDVVYQRTGCPLHTTYVPAKLRWLWQELPREFAKAWKFVSVKEWVIAQLTGELCCDLGIASGSGLLNIETKAWDHKILTLSGITAHRLADLAEPRTIFNGFHSNYSRGGGLPAQIPIVIGTSDAASSSIGTGAVGSDTLTVMVGTSAAARVLSAKPLLDPAGRSWCYYAYDDNWVVGGATNNGGNVLSWFLREFGGRSFADLSIEAAKASPGSAGLLFLPFLAGERAPNWNSHARGFLWGLNLSHGRQHILRSTMEGIAYQVKGIYDTLQRLCPSFSSVRATGGFAYSDIWLSIMAGVLGTSLDVFPNPDGSAIGAAALARAAVLGLPNLEWIGSCLQPSRSIEPCSSDLQDYREIYQRYLKLYELLEPEFEHLASWEGS